MSAKVELLACAAADTLSNDKKKNATIKAVKD
jgi:hypothetical protein